MEIKLKLPLKPANISFLMPWFVITVILLIYRGLQKFFLGSDFSLSGLLSAGVLFSSGIWLLLLPLVYLAYIQFSIYYLSWIKFISYQLLASILIGLLHTYLFVYLHSLIWPGILNPQEVLHPVYILADLRLNFFIYWLLIGGFYVQNVPGRSYFEKIFKNNSNQEIDESNNIVFIKAMGNYVLINTLVNKKVTSKIIRRSMNEILTTLPYPRFLRVHRSFIVNRDFVKSSSRASHGEYRLELTTGDKITSSREMKTKIKEWLKQNSFSNS